MRKHILSLGAGVQSSTVALMAEHGEIKPKPDAAIFADTQFEPLSVYKWLNWLEAQLSFPVYRVTKGSLELDGLEVRQSKKSGKWYQRNLVPLFIRKPNGQKGMLPRKCTRDYKLDMIIRKDREIVGIKKAVKDVRAIQWIGISTDEAARMKPSGHSWILNRWPLIAKGMSREDCFAWMQAHGYPRPPRSACVICTYHSDAEWLRLKTEEPDEFARAVEWERKCQMAALQDEVIIGVPYLHESLVPLDQVVFRPGANAGQFNNVCEGICGV